MKLDKNTLERLSNNDPSLTSLNLAHNQIGDRPSAKHNFAFFDLIKSIRYKANFSFRRRSGEGAQALAEALTRNSSLTIARLLHLTSGTTSLMLKG